MHVTNTRLLTNEATITPLRNCRFTAGVGSTAGLHPFAGGVTHSCWRGNIDSLRSLLTAAYDLEGAEHTRAFRMTHHLGRSGMTSAMRRWVRSSKRSDRRRHVHPLEFAAADRPVEPSSPRRSPLRSAQRSETYGISSAKRGAAPSAKWPLGERFVESRGNARSAPSRGSGSSSSGRRHCHRMETPWLEIPFAPLLPIETAPKPPCSYPCDRDVSRTCPLRPSTVPRNARDDSRLRAS